MSKLFIAGAAGVCLLGGLALLPQISTAATPTYVTAPSQGVGTADAPTSVGFGPGYFAPAFAANRQAAYRSCFMKRTVTYTAQGPKAVTTPVCDD